MPARPSSLVKGAVLRDDTLLRLGGNGDDFFMTWAADDRQYFPLCDGNGWAERPTKYYNSCMHIVSGGPHDASFEPMAGYPECLAEVADLSTWDASRYYSFGTLAVDGSIYQFVTTPNVPLAQPEPRYIGAKLIYSPDNGNTWFNQDGSTPVVWEWWDERTKDNMVFFYEPGDAFNQLAILQMGKDYQANEDGYIYVYGPNGNVDGTMNQLVMFRVEKGKILDRGSYEYFTGFGEGDRAKWGKDIEERGVVHAFPRGWVSKTEHPWAWLPSVVYNEPLGVYMMACWGTGCAPDGRWFGKPSYLGLWVADNPWGPWDQIHEETAWTPGGDLAARAYSAAISPKWIAEDGKSFWLVWSDFQVTSGNVDRPEPYERMLDEARARGASYEEVLKEIAEYRPNYGFNTQRIDLILE
jgi:hypothetical protein